MEYISFTKVNGTLDANPPETESPRSETANCSPAFELLNSRMEHIAFTKVNGTLDANPPETVSPRSETANCSPAFELLNRMEHISLTEVNGTLDANSPKTESPQSETANCSSTSSNSPLCRICKDSASSEKLITPCNCSGSMAYVHLSCLENWLTVGRKTQCEVCKLQYETTMKSLPCYYWLAHPGSFTACGPFWLGMILLLFTLFAGLLIFLCFFVTQHYSFKDNMKGLYVTYFLLFVVYLLFYVILIHLFIRRINWWIEEHQFVRLVQAPKEIVV